MDAGGASVDVVILPGRGCRCRSFAWPCRSGVQGPTECHRLGDPVGGTKRFTLSEQMWAGGAQISTHRFRIVLIYILAWTLKRTLWCTAKGRPCPALPRFQGPPKCDNQPKRLCRQCDAYRESSIGRWIFESLGAVQSVGWFDRFWSYRFVPKECFIRKMNQIWNPRTLFSSKRNKCTLAHDSCIFLSRIRTLWWHHFGRYDLPGFSKIGNVMLSGYLEKGPYRTTCHPSVIFDQLH